MKVYTWLLPIALTGGALCAHSSDAQESDSEDSLETILVTATRGATVGADLPVAWSVIDSEAIAFTSLQHSNQLFQRVAGTWISRGNGQESLISMRSPVLTGSGSCGAFMTAADGVPIRAPGFCNVNQLFDANLAQAGVVEVVRGPSTAVYGSNAMHGVINVISASADTAANAVRVEAGSRDYYRVLASAALPENGTAINLQAASYGGYQDDSGYDQQKLTIRSDRDVGNWSMTGIIDGSNLNQETAGYIQGFEAYKDDDAREQNPNPEAYRDAWSVRAQVTGTRELTNGRSIRLTPYFRQNEMEFLQHFLPWQPVERNGHTSFGLQSAFTNTSDRSDWMLGVDVDFTQGWLDEIQESPFSPNQPEGVHYDYEVDALVIGLFAQGNVQLSDTFRLDGGIRLEDTDYDYDNLTGDGDACEPTASACRFYRPADRSDSFGNWSGNAALSYDLGAARLYTRVARGFRAPQTSELYRLQSGQQVADIDSEQIDSFEVGVRGLLTNGLSYAINGYWMRKDEVIFQDRDRQNVSGAATDHEGVEIELDWQFNDVWYAALAASVAEHRYASPIELIGSRGDIEGNDIDTAPSHFGSARVGANTSLGNKPMKAELEYVWLDEYFIDPNNEHSYAGHELVNLRADMHVNERTKLSIVITNLLDESYAERADFGFGQYRYFVGEPRSAVVGLSWSLD